MIEPIKVCTNCVMDTTDPAITFDEKGVCDFCNDYYKNILPSWHPNAEGEKELVQIAETIKKNRKKKGKYDCIIGLSGGTDSSYLCYVAKEIMHLNPLIYVVDTGWNLNVAVENIEKIVKALDLDMYTEVVNWQEMKDLQLAFFKSQVPYQDLPQDHAIFAGLYNYAVKHKIKFVLTGSNIATESIRPPVEWVYLNDIKLIKSIHKKFGSTRLKTFPLCGMFKYRIYYAYLKGMKRIAPLDYIPYEKDYVQMFLHERFDWEPYENKHYENIFTRFYEGYYLIKKFGYDKRKCYLSNHILAKEMSREEALEVLMGEPYPEKQALEDMEYISKKLGLSIEEFKIIIGGENKSYRDYPNHYWLIRKALDFSRLIGVEKRSFR
jgi:N-acetyl sugar amidotransferase